MIYLTIHVKEIKKSINFYTNRLGLFRYLGADRVSCLQQDLIIDFTESNEKKLLEFGIFFPNGLTIKEHLKENDISFKCSSNMAGTFLSTVDEDGNKINLITECLEMN